MNRIKAFEKSQMLETANKKQKLTANTQLFQKEGYDDKHNSAFINRLSLQRQFNHQFTGALFSNNISGKVHKGSGVLISPNLVLTSASNIFRNFIEMKDIIFYPGLNGTISTRCRAADFRYPQQFTQPFSSSRHDFCLIKLKERVPNLDQSNQLSLGINFNDLRAAVGIYGFQENGSQAYDYNGVLTKGYQAKFEKQTVTKINNTQIIYHIKAADELIGSPVITGINQDVIVGIHKGGVIQQRQVKMGVKLTLEIILMLEIWRQQLGGDKFKVVDVESGQQIDTSCFLFKSFKNYFLMTKNELALNDSFGSFAQTNEFKSYKDQILDQYHKQLLQGLYQDIDMLDNKLKEQIQEKETIQAQLEASIIKLQLQINQSSKNFNNLKARHKEQLTKLQEHLMECEYWIVEADRLHYSLSEAIANSPFTQKFAEFRRVAERTNSMLEEEMGSWEVHTKEQTLGGSFIQSGIIQKDAKNSSRLQKRLTYQLKLQMFQQIIENFLLTFTTQ